MTIHITEKGGDRYKNIKSDSLTEILLSASWLFDCWVFFFVFFLK